MMQNRHARTMRLVRVCHWWSHCLQCSVLTELTGLVASNNANRRFEGCFLYPVSAGYPNSLHITQHH